MACISVVSDDERYKSFERAALALRSFAPVAPAVLAFGARTQRCARSEVECERPVEIGPVTRNAGIGIALHHLRSRVTEAIAIAGREHSDLRCDGAKERSRGRCPAAVMRRDQHVGFERSGLLQEI